MARPEGRKDSAKEIRKCGCFYREEAKAVTHGSRKEGILGREDSPVMFISPSMEPVGVFHPLAKGD